MLRPKFKPGSWREQTAHFSFFFEVKRNDFSISINSSFLYLQVADTAMTDYNTTGPWPQICKIPPFLLRLQTDKDAAASLAVDMRLMSGQASAYPYTSPRLYSSAENCSERYLIIFKTPVLPACHMARYTPGVITL